MNKLSITLIGVLTCIFLFIHPSESFTQTAEEPVALTSCGQSPGPVRLKIFMKRLSIDYDYNLLITANDLVAAKKAGKPFKSLIIVTGASLKGMGAAGVSMDDELARTKGLLDEAKKQGIKVIGAHIEGMARRSQGAASGDSSDEQSIDAVCPNSAFMIIKKDGNKDGRFTTISKGKNIPIVMFEMNSEIPGVLSKIFNK